MVYIYLLKINTYIYINIYIYIYIYIYDDIEFISTKIGSCRPLRSCGKRIIIK